MERHRPFPTTHTGSLPRPDGLLELLLARERGEPADGSFEDAVRHAVVDVVARQLEVGIDILGDGEMSKPSYATYVKDRLSGFSGVRETGVMPRDLEAFPGYARRVLGESPMKDIRMPACTGPVSYRDTRAVHRDIENLEVALAGVQHADAFLTAASPGVIALFLPNRHYPDEDTYLAALAEAMRVEYRAILDAGFLLQIDAPDLAMGHHLAPHDETIDDHRARVERHVSALNEALRDLPPERMRLHVCWGNYEGPHHLDVGLEAILDLVLGARPAGLSFVAANPRHEHEWHVFERVALPEGKVILPGVVDPTTNFVEHPELVAERLSRFAGLVGADRVIASTDCGFATFAGMRAVDPSIAWAKLASLAEGAALARSRAG